MKLKIHKGDSRTPVKINNNREQIDQMVYELYGLSEEEIKIVEGTTKDTLSH